MITLFNESKSTIRVAVNRWADGDTSFFKINNGGTEKWDRGDENGFVMAIKFDSNIIKRYYVKADSVITVEPLNIVLDGVNTINPVG
ncbi:hypothetical protein [Flavobacterium polysaccharolyticum]|uniref:Uncharacterized protein n=1 Tax=Flavobacterium polysaccharolyticum TaxID=3133148 RepID=A0ABU9NJ82_9FLAO